MNGSRVIQLDPYFDRLQASPAAHQVASGPLSHSALIPAQHEISMGNSTAAWSDGGDTYRDPSQVVTSRGTMAVSAPSSPAGVRGTVIPHATLGGIPAGTTPHVTQDVEVTIDPHIIGQSSVVRLGDLNAATVAQATQQAQHTTPEPHNIATLRLRGSAVMHSLSQGGMQKEAVAPSPQQTGPVPAFQPQVQGQVQPIQPQQQQLPQVPQQQLPQVPQQQPMQQLSPVSPMTAFNQPIVAPPTVTPQVVQPGSSLP